MSTQSLLKIAIIDDEPKALKLLRLTLEMHFPNVSIVAACDSFESGFHTLKNLDLDLVFIDVSLGSHRAFNLFDQLSQVNFQTIFCSNFPENKREPYKYSVVDYIIKPLKTEALYKAMELVSSNINKQTKLNATHQSTMLNLVHKEKDDLQEEEKECADVVTVPLLKGHVSIIHVDEILRCESRGGLSTIYFAHKDDKIIATKSLRECELQFPKKQFFRTHKQHIINLQYVDRLHIRPKPFVELINGEKIQLARRRKGDFIDSYRRFKSQKKYIIDL